MRKPIIFAALTLTVGLSGLARAGDDLFSEIETESVFNSQGGRPVAAAPQSRTGNGAPQRLIAGLSLSDMLLAAGFDPKSVSDGGVTVNVRRDDSTFPVRATLSDDDKQLQLGMQLAQLPADQTVPSDTLLSLMQANLDHRPAAFAFNKQERRIELHLVVGSDAMTTVRLRGHLDQLAEIAGKTKDLWAISGATLGSSTTTGSTATDSAAAPATAQSSLVGKWVASRTATDAFALQINADGTFRLAVVSGTKKTQSKGQFTLSDATLTLVGEDGTRLSGTIETQTDGFVLQMAGATGKSSSMTFKRAS